MKSSAALLVCLTAVISVSTSGCASMGSMGQSDGETAPQAVATFKPGVTTYDEVKARIGDPVTVVNLGDGSISASFNNGEQEAIKGTVRGTAEGVATDNAYSATSDIPYAGTAIGLARNIFDIKASHSSTAYFCTLTFDSQKIFVGGGCSQN